jgi:phosphoglycolate phosphatase-like HAD superfamily hydrolase
MSAPDPHQELKAFKPTQGFFVGIDSDGCAFDTMEPKHKECFCPVTVWKWDLAAVSKYAREAWDFVNLYSKQRGCNRFHALEYVMDHLRARPEVRRRGTEIPRLESLRAWTSRAKALGNPELAAEVARTGDAELTRVLDWSKAINEMVAKLVKNVPPFPGVREALQLLSGKADMMVVSATPGEALRREWQEHGIAAHMAIIAGQEMGTKKDHLALGAGGKYAADRILMIGDAPGDYKAALANKALFFPINPAHEEESWALFVKEAGPKFLAGEYTRDYEARLIKEFDKLLPEEPPWAENSD